MNALTNTVGIHAKRKTALKNLIFLLLCALAGTAAVVILLLVAALLIKNMHPSDGVISVLCTVIKLIGAAVCARIASKQDAMHPVFAAATAAGIEVLLSTALFCILNKSLPGVGTAIADMFMAVVGGALFGILFSAGKRSKGRKR